MLQQQGQGQLQNNYMMNNIGPQQSVNNLLQSQQQSGSVANFGIPPNNKGPINYIKNSSSYNNTYSSPSCPQVQKLRNQYINSPAMDSGYSCNSSVSGSSIGNNYTASWMQNYHSTILPSFSGNGTPSVMSNMSHLSMADDCSVLSVSTQMTAQPHIGMSNPHNSHTGQHTPSTTSYSENVDPNFYHQINSFLDQLLISLRDPNDMVQRKAVNSILDMAKNKYFYYVRDSSKLQILIESFLNLIAEKSTNKETVLALLGAMHYLTQCKRTISIITRVFTLSRGKLVHVLCDRIEPEEKYANYASITLHTLFCQPEPIGSQARSCARSFIVIDKLLNTVKTNVRYYKYLMIDCIRMIIHSNGELKNHFARQGGILQMLRCIADDNDERVLYTASKTLFTMINSDKKDFAEEFVKLEGIQLLGNQLSHGSSRFLHECVKCLSGVSDTDNLQNQDIREAIGKVIQLLGSNDPIIAWHGSGFLSNIAAKSQSIKEHLTDCGAIENLICLIEMYCIQKPPSNLKHIYNEILDNSLTALGNLTANYRNPKYVQIACYKLIQRQEAPKLLLNMIVIGNLVIKNRALLLIHRVIYTELNLLKSFLDVRDSFNNKNAPGLLYELLFEAVQNYSNTPSTDSSKRRYKDTIERTLRILDQLANHPTFHMELCQLAQYQNNPMYLLEYLKDTDQGVLLQRLIDHLLDVVY